MNASTEVTVGDRISTGPRRTGYPEWNRFAAVNDEFVPIHMDDEEGRRAGYPGSIAMGRLLWSYAHRLLRDWQPEGRVVALSLRFRGPVLRDAPFELRATVTGVREQQGERLVDVDLSIEDEAGSVLAPGTATVTLPGS
ncbi:MaoC family dehydratase [Nocardioides sp. NPDC101246]|uniref:MaoC family dehydratase n=1 Tax=Nocardioides sp. NPDC101246 TaxID=3364336 RepID=UPI0037F77BA7